MWRLKRICQSGDAIRMVSKRDTASVARMSVATSGVLFTKIPHIAAIMRTTALLALAAWGGGLQSTPKNQAHGVVLRRKRAGQNLLIHRHKSKSFDFAAA